MTKEFRTLDGFAIDLNGDTFENTNTRWHQIALEGSWDGHWMGAFSLTDRMFDEAIEHFNSLKNDVLVDYEHASVFSDKAPAAGWIKALEKRRDENGSTLHARVEWTRAASNHIRENEYKYLSPTIVFHTRDRKSGKLKGASIHSVALTNTPFLDELPEVRLNSIKSVLSGVSVTPSKKEKELMNGEQKKQLCEALGLSDTASVEELLEKAKSVSLSARSAENSIVALKAKNEELTLAASEVEELRRQAEKAIKLEAEARVRKATEEGKITASNQDWAYKLALSNGEAFDEWAACAPSVVPIEIKKQPEEVRANSRIDKSDIEKAAKLLSDSEIESISKLGLSVEDYLKFNPEEVKELLCR